MDGGKPIKESRDFDLPLAAAHFFYYAGWADKLDYAFPESQRRAARRGRADHPVEFPAAHGGVENRARARRGNTVVLKPAETTQHHRAACSREIFQEAELPPGVVNIVTGAGETGAALVEHPDVDKIAFTGSTDVGKRIQRALAGTKKKLTLELGGKAANIIFDDAPIDQAVEGIINGIYFNQGHVCCAGSRLLVQEVDCRAVIRKLRDRIAHAARRRSARQEHRHRRHQLARAARKDPASSSIAGVDEGAEMFQPRCALPARGYWFPPTFFTGVAQRSASRRRRSSARCWPC